MSTATLADVRATHVRLSIPAWGVAWADVSLDGEVTLSGQTTLKVADLSIACTVMSGGPANGRSYYRVAAGNGKWGTDVAAKSYANDAGVKAATILTEAAAECGETLDATTLPSTQLGPSYVREAGPAGLVLGLLSPQAWYVGEDGVTRLGTRASSDYKGSGQIGVVDLARGIVPIAAEEIATLLPGVVVEGVTASDVQHELTPQGLRTTIYGNAVTSRRLLGYKRLFNALFPENKYRGVFEYRVVTQETERLNLQPVRVSTGLPDLRRVFVRPGVAGCRTDVALGSRVLVAFVDANPAFPAVVAFEDAEGAGFMPSRLDLAGGHARVLRDGERVAITDAVNPITNGIITIHPTVVTEGAPPLGKSKVRA